MSEKTRKRGGASWMWRPFPVCPNREWYDGKLPSGFVWSYLPCPPALRRVKNMPLGRWYPVRADIAKARLDVQMKRTSTASGVLSQGGGDFLVKVTASLLHSAKPLYVYVDEEDFDGWPDAAERFAHRWLDAYELLAFCRVREAARKRKIRE